MASENTTDGPELTRATTSENTNGAFTVAFSAPSGTATVENTTLVPKTTATAALCTPFRAPLVADTDPQPSGRSASSC